MQVCERIPTIATQLKILSTVKATMLGAQGELRNSYNYFKEARRERSSFRLSLIGTEIKETLFDIHLSRIPRY